MVLPNDTSVAVAEARRDVHESLGLSLVDPDGEMDQADDSEDQTLRNAWSEVREALTLGASTAAVLNLMDQHDRAAIRQQMTTTPKEG